MVILDPKTGSQTCHKRATIYIKLNNKPLLSTEKIIYGLSYILERDRELGMLSGRQFETPVASSLSQGGVLRSKVIMPRQLKLL